MIHLILLLSMLLLDPGEASVDVAVADPRVTTLSIDEPASGHPVRQHSGKAATGRTDNGDPGSRGVLNPRVGDYGAFDDSAAIGELVSRLGSRIAREPGCASFVGAVPESFARLSISYVDRTGSNLPARPPDIPAAAWEVISSSGIDSLSADEADVFGRTYKSERRSYIFLNGNFFRISSEEGQLTALLHEYLHAVGCVGAEIDVDYRSNYQSIATACGTAPSVRASNS